MAVAELTVRTLCAEPKARVGAERSGDIHPAELSLGTRSPGGLVRSVAALGGERANAPTCFPCAAWPAAGRSIGHIPHASQQAFLEAHELAFAYFGGVFGSLSL